MADGEEMVADLAGARCVVEGDAIAVEALDMPIDQHERILALLQAGEVILRAIADGSDDQALDTMRNEIADVVALQPEIALAVAEQDAKGRPSRRRFGAVHDRCEERIGDVGNDQPDRLRFCGDEAAGDPARRDS